MADNQKVELLNGLENARVKREIGPAGQHKMDRKQRR